MKSHKAVSSILKAIRHEVDRDTVLALVAIVAVVALGVAAVILSLAQWAAMR